MPDPAWVAVGGTLCINGGLAFYVAGAMREQVRSLMEWREKEVNPTMKEHANRLAVLQVSCPLLHEAREHRR